MFSGSNKIKLSRFSLRTLIVGSYFLGVILAWLAHHYRDYRAEQVALQGMVSRLFEGCRFVVFTNGESQSLAPSSGS